MRFPTALEYVLSRILWKEKDGCWGLLFYGYYSSAVKP